jgi:DNA-binding transcriptional LysR family regulator
MEWDDFRNFLAVARSGSLSGAARALDTSAATVGRRIAALEKRLAARLFDRGQTGYALTESGEAIRLKAEEVEEAVLALERAALGRDLRAGGKVRLATAEDIASFVIAPMLAQFHRTYPHIVVEMVASWDVVNLTRREADIALRTARPTQGDFVVRHVGVWIAPSMCREAMRRHGSSTSSGEILPVCLRSTSLLGPMTTCFAAMIGSASMRVGPMSYSQRTRAISKWLHARLASAQLSCHVSPRMQITN